MTSERFGRLVDLLATLRGPGGCPWDREQTHQSLREALLEEAWEVIAEIDQQHAEGLKEELGDLLLHVVFHSQIAAENNQFTIDDVVDGVAEKLVRRHPHVFGDARAATAKDVEQTWERVKQQEANGKPKPKVPPALPALMAASKVQARLEKRKPVNPQHNVDRLRNLLDSGLDPEAEIGRLLYDMVTLSRLLDVDPEMALSQTLMKHAYDE